MTYKLHPELEFDIDKEVENISAKLRKVLSQNLRRRGFVVAISGGIDSSVSASLAVKALGPDRVFGILMPEQDSSSNSLKRGKALAEHLGIKYEVKDIAPVLEALGCYDWRDSAIQKTIPEYGEGWKNKIIITGGMEGKFNHFNIVVESPEGERQEKRLSINEYLQIVASTNFKQRVRKNLEYFHADRLNYAVIGTPNRVEYDQGFFVKNGDGAADVKPIAHLYKTQVYAIAHHLGLPEEICNAIPTTDTYSLEQGQDEFYYALPYPQMDVALLYFNLGKTSGDLAGELGINEDQAAYVFSNIEKLRSTTGVLHWPALLLEQVDGPQKPPVL